MHVFVNVEQQRVFGWDEILVRILGPPHNAAMIRRLGFDTDIQFVWLQPLKGHFQVTTTQSSSDQFDGLFVSLLDIDVRI